MDDYIHLSDAETDLKVKFQSKIMYQVELQ
jgi:hypothetical protein